MTWCAPFSLRETHKFPVLLLCFAADRKIVPGQLPDPADGIHGRDRREPEHFIYVGGAASEICGREQARGTTSDIQGFRGTPSPDYS